MRDRLVLELQVGLDEEPLGATYTLQSASLSLIELVLTHIFCFEPDKRDLVRILGIHRGHLAYAPSPLSKGRGWGEGKE